MRLDIRLPIGALFLLLGTLLLAYGLFGDAPPPHGGGSTVINLVWGAVMAAFGLGMLLLARLGR